MSAMTDLNILAATAIAAQKKKSAAERLTLLLKTLDPQIVTQLTPLIEEYKYDFIHNYMAADEDLLDSEDVSRFVEAVEAVDQLGFVDAVEGVEAVEKNQIVEAVEPPSPHAPKQRGSTLPAKPKRKQSARSKTAFSKSNLDKRMLLKDLPTARDKIDLLLDLERDVPRVLTGELTEGARYFVIMQLRPILHCFRAHCSGSVETFTQKWTDQFPHSTFKKNCQKVCGAEY